MKCLIKISETVIARLSKTKEPCFGKLYGTCFQNTLTIIGLQTDIEGGLNLSQSFPAEVDFWAIFQVYESNVNEERAKKYVNAIDVTDNPVFVTCKIGEENKIDVHILTKERKEKATFVVVTEEEIYTQYIQIHLKGKLSIKSELNEKAIEETFLNIRKSISTGIAIFAFPKTNVFLLGNDSENGTVGISGETNLEEVYEDSNGVNEGSSRKKKPRKFELSIVDINMLTKISKESQDKTNVHAPLCILEKKSIKSINTVVRIDSLAMVHKQTKVSDLYEILLESTIRYLRLYESKLTELLRANSEDSSKISEVETFHFYPVDCKHFITRLYSKAETEESLTMQRLLLHKQLLLDVSMPVFRRGNKYPFLTSSNCNCPLINPHEGLKPTDNGGRVALVKGKYEYYHYCQNKMDDNGWGCAYRSLQTLASWFKLQGYTHKEVPTFKDIQKCLFDIGDKPASIVGSRQWIGSTEVNYVLDSLLGVSSKILYVSSGEEMASKGPELVNHFETQGTPIMIGGGVLAHTILGVDYNQETGELRFLILDPHYTGGEDLHVIQSKGWCGWKKVDFWEKSAYYNMCLPQVRREI